MSSIRRSDFGGGPEGLSRGAFSIFRCSRTLAGAAARKCCPLVSCHGNIDLRVSRFICMLPHKQVTVGGQKRWPWIPNLNPRIRTLSFPRRASFTIYFCKWKSLIRIKKRIKSYCKSLEEPLARIIFANGNFNNRRLFCMQMQRVAMFGIEMQIRRRVPNLFFR